MKLGSKMTDQMKRVLDTNFWADSEFWQKGYSYCKERPQVQKDQDHQALVLLIGHSFQQEVVAF